MKVIVDTCIWSYALRRNNKNQDTHVQELQELINEVRVQIIGPIRQEILSGIKTKKQFQALKMHLQAFPDLPVETEDFELAADFSNTARKKGLQGSNTDFLICAVASKYKMSIFTTDNDFIYFEKHLPIKLHKPRQQKE
jgi:hypothetical protein